MKKNPQCSLFMLTDSTVAFLKNKFTTGLKMFWYVIDLNSVHREIILMSYFPNMYIFKSVNLKIILKQALPESTEQYAIFFIQWRSWNSLASWCKLTIKEDVRHAPPSRWTNSITASYVRAEREFQSCKYFHLLS